MNSSSPSAYLGGTEARRRKITVIGGTGNTGRALIAELLSRGDAVTVVSRRPDRVAFPSEAVTSVAANLADPGSLAATVAGVDAIHYIPPLFAAQEEGFVQNIIAAAETAGVSRIVYHSVLHAATPNMPHHARKAAVELRLRYSSLHWTIIQPAMYAQTALLFFDRRRNLLAPGFNVSRSFAPVDIHDLAEAAAIILNDDSHAFATYELAGPELLDFTTMARHLGRVVGADVRAEATDPVTLSNEIAVRLSLSVRAAKEIRVMLNHYDHHGLAGNGKVFEMILGRTPTDFATAVRRTLNGIRS